MLYPLKGTIRRILWITGLIFGVPKIRGTLLKVVDIRIVLLKGDYRPVALYPDVVEFQVPQLCA